MDTVFNHIMSLCENRSLAVGDIIDTSHVNFDPVKAIGRIRDVKEDGDYTVEYPDGEMGILVSPKNIIFLDNSRYEKYIEEVRSIVEDDPELDISKIIHKVNHWIRKKKKSTNLPKQAEIPDMNKDGIAKQVLKVTEGFADAIPQSVGRKEGKGELWIPIKQHLGHLRDKDGKIVPTNKPLALKVSGISHSFADVGELEGTEVTNVYTVAMKDLVDAGVFLSASRGASQPSAMPKPSRGRLSGEAMPRTAHDRLPGEGF